MEMDERPRFNQDTGERIIYEDEVEQQGLEQAVAQEPATQEPATQQPEVTQEQATQQPAAQEQAVQQPEAAQEPAAQQPVAQQPAAQQPAAQPVAKKSGCAGCLKGCLVTLVVFIVIVGLLIVGGYAFYKINQPKDVEFDQEDVESFYDKTGVDNDDYLLSVEDVLVGNATASGEASVNTSFTNAEITGVIQDAADKNDLFENVNVRFVGKDRVEVFATISEDLDDLYDVVPDLENLEFIVDNIKGKQVYYIGDVIYDQENGFELSIDKLKVGLFRIPTSIVDEFDEEVETLVNNIVDNMPGFNVESMEINEDSLDFVGTIPEMLE